MLTGVPRAIIDSGSKPFACPSCRRQFSRQDSLSRHIKLHRQPNQPLDPVTEGLAPQGHVLESEHRPTLSDAGHAPLRQPSGAEMRTLEPVADSINTLSDLRENNSITIPTNHDGDVHLTWPDSEDLLQTILSADLESWQLPLDLLPLPQHDTQRTVFDHFYPTQDLTLLEEASPAVRNLSQMITAKVSLAKVSDLRNHVDSDTSHISLQVLPQKLNLTA